MVCDRGCVCEYLWKNVLFCVVFLCLFWSEARASTTRRSLWSWGRLQMQAFSVRCSSWLSIYTKAKHSSTLGQANRGSFDMPDYVWACVPLCDYQPLGHLFNSWLTANVASCVQRTYLCLQRWRHELCQWVKVNEFTWNGVA